MRLSTLIMVLIVLLTACPRLRCAETSHNDSGVAVQKVQIAEGVFQFISDPDGYVPNGNSIVIVNERDVLVFDTLARPSTARTVLEEIRKSLTNQCATW